MGFQYRVSTYYFLLFDSFVVINRFKRSTVRRRESAAIGESNPSPDLNRNSLVLSNRLGWREQGRAKRFGALLAPWNAWILLPDPGSYDFRIFSNSAMKAFGPPSTYPVSPIFLPAASK